MYKIAVCGDMSKMFNQIAVKENDHYHRFLWRNGDLSISVKVYQWLRVLFGDKPSPELASYAIRFLTEKYSENYSEAVEVLNDNTYGDDIGYSVHDENTDNKIKGEIDEILDQGKFTKTWNSNSPKVDQNPEQYEINYLGHFWDKKFDKIGIKRKYFEPGDN